MAAAGDAAGPAPQTVADATHDLYRQYGKQIYAYCLHQLRSREEAEDAVQTTFLNAFRGLQRGTTTRFEQAWLYKIAQNVCIARRSSSGRRLRLESPDDFEILQEVVPSATPTEGDTLELMGLDAALDSMPENQRRAILMREWQGMSYREIATELGLTQGAVEMLIFRARRTLAHALEQPAAEKKRARKARAGFSFGSLIAAMQPLFSTGAAVKMAAVAVSAAVVSTNGVVPSVISQSTPAKKRTIATTHAGVTRLQTVAAERQPVAAGTHRRAVTAPAPVRRSVAPETGSAVVAEGIEPGVQPVGTTPSPPTPAQSTVPMAPPQHVPAPPPQQTPASAPVTSTPPSTPAPASAPPATVTQTQTTTATVPASDRPGGRRNDVRIASNLPQQPGDTTTTTTTTTTTITTPTPAPIGGPTPVEPDPVTAPVTTTSTPSPDPTATQPTQPPPTPSTTVTWHGDGHGNGGGHDGWGDGGGRHGHH